jgi:catechol 2,3-dioxygenase-like lactoylglutathione lyase family enzyme
MWQHPPMGTILRVSDLDHIVLVASDVERTVAWYCDLLGLEPVRVDEWRRGEAPFPSVRVNASTIIDLITGSPTEGRLDHLCLVVEPTDLAAIAASGEFTVVDGPAPRFGARGEGTSLYVRDPDGLVVELRHY